MADLHRKFCGFNYQFVQRMLCSCTTDLFAILAAAAETEYELGSS